MMCNINSKVAKNINDVFKHSHYKTLLTGTSTRNNINEIYSQLSFMYRSSYNFLDTCETIFKQNIKTKEIESKDNKNKNKPFKMYSKGYTEFSRCFNPSKATVLGIGKQNQDVYNVDKLNNILEHSVLTRTLEDVIGRKIFKYHQIQCSFNNAEIELVKTIINEFHTIRNKYFRSTGNYRKDAMFRVLQQLNLLVRACATPHTFDDCNINYSSKFYKIEELINDFGNQRVAIGVRRLESVSEYHKFLKCKYPDRNIYTVTGSMSFKNRVELIKTMKDDNDCILVFTQQSLSSSVNIDFVDKIIVPELAWNMSSISQAIMRFCRYTSKNVSDIYFVTYENSIEVNLLKMLTTKERLNDVIKKDDRDIESELGIDDDIFDQLLSKEYDEDGKSTIQVNWGEQEIS